MKLNNITSLHTRADIDHKDVVWDFIVEQFRDSMEGCIEYKDDRFAVYSEHGKLVEVFHEGCALRIESADHDAALEIAHKLVDPCEENKESDVYGKIFDPADDPKLRAMFVSFFHSNTSDLKCRYTVSHEGKTYEGEFFLDMLSEHYDCLHEGIPGDDDWPDEHVFCTCFPTDDLELFGIEIQVRLHATTGECTETEAYLWRMLEDSRGENYYENYDTIAADIEIINIETNEIINK